MAFFGRDWLYVIVVLGLACSALALLWMVYELSDGPPCNSFLCMRQVSSGIIVFPSTIYFLMQVRNWRKPLDEQHEMVKEAKLKADAERTEQLENYRKIVQENGELMGDLVTGHLEDFALDAKNDVNASFRNMAAAYTRADLENLKTFTCYVLELLISCAWFPDGPDSVQVKIHDSADPKAVCEEFSTFIDRFIESLPHKQDQRTGRGDGMLHQAAIRDAGLQPHAPNGDSLPAAGLQLHAPSRNSLLSTQPVMGWLRRRPRESSTQTRQATGTAGKFPYTCELGPLELEVLSTYHLMLLVTFFFDIALIIAEIEWQRPWSASLLISNCLCVASTLVFFTMIDYIEAAKAEKERIEADTEQLRKDYREAKAWADKNTSLAKNFKNRTKRCLQHTKYFAKQPELLNHTSLLIEVHENTFGLVADWENSRPVELTQENDRILMRLTPGTDGKLDGERLKDAVGPRQRALPVQGT